MSGVAGHWSQNAWNQIVKWKDETGRTRERCLRFRDFLEFTSDTDYFARYDWHLNGHLAQQFVPGEEELVDSYYPIESFACWAAEIERTYGLPRADHAFLSESHHHKRFYDESSIDPSSFEVFPEAFARGTYPKYDGFLDEQLIETAYGADIAAYGYLYPVTMDR